MPNQSSRLSQHKRSLQSIVLFLVIPLLFFSVAPLARAADAPPVVKKPLAWYTTYQQACSEARKADKMVICYFCSSDGDEFCKKLDKEVFSTDMFREFAEKNVTLLKFDYLKYKGAQLAQETMNRYKTKYNVTKVPTILFLDPDGLLVARCGYDTASLREDEDKGKPAKWIAYCQETIKNRPPPQKLIEQKTLDEALKAAKKHYLATVILLTNEAVPLALTRRTDLLKNQPFVQFINQNYTFCQMKWPDDGDNSETVVATRAFIEKYKIGKVPMQLIVYDYFVQPPTSNVKERINVTQVADVDPIVEKLEKNISNPDYSGAWLDDWRQANFISSRLKRPMFILFTQMDTSEPSQKFDAEVFQTPEFKAYAKKNLVLMKVEFWGSEEKKKAQPAALAEQSQQLADQYAIRGYPWVIIRNFMGQRIGESKYMKGGPEFFVKQVDGVVKDDRFSRP